MSQSTHTYGPTCHLTRNVSFSGLQGGDEVPDLKPQYFYYSTHDVNDPLSAVPVPTSSETKPFQHPPQPFSARDNNALEEAWRGIATDKDKKRHKHMDVGYGSRKSSVNASSGKSSKGLFSKKHNKSEKAQTYDSSSIRFPNVSSGEATASDTVSKAAELANTLAFEPTANNGEEPRPMKGGKRSRGDKEASGTKEETDRGSQDGISEQKPVEADSDCEHNDHSALPSASEAQSDALAYGGVLPFIPARDPSCCEVLNAPVGDQAASLRGKPSCCEHTGPQPNHDDDSQTHDAELSKPKREKLQKRSSSRQKPAASQGDGADDTPIEQSVKELKKLAGQEYDSLKIPDGKQEKSKDRKAEHKQSKTTHESDAIYSQSSTNKSGDTGTTGFPFVKLPLRIGSPRPRSSHSECLDSGDNQCLTVGQRDGYFGESSRGHDRDSTETEPVFDHDCKSHKDTEYANIPVGVSRLHVVELPTLTMKPIYWSHVHDTAPVIRGTWFYKDSMLPVEPAVANQLEMGYRELRPWSQTWSDELSSAVEVGAAGEEKIVHRLWTQDERKSRKSKQHLLSTNPHCAARCFQGEASAEGTLDTEQASVTDTRPRIINKKYPNSQVIYKDSQNAFILKPNLQPSAYYGRKPLQKIKRDKTVGIHVVRGFDRNAWEKLHPTRKPTPGLKSEANVPVSGDAASASNNTSCPACRSADVTPNVTDLCLVIHGIGQKLSERVESFNFTHACNSVRRAVNVELGTESVKKVLRDDLGGMMVLPVNWRSRLSFDDGGPMRDGDKDKSKADFSLKDITPDTIPAVRNMICDVMLDIPFYMSHHKQKMIQAVVAEANRVYRLWCKNNPNFHNNGRVHIVAHSLGSAMAIEILSKQPTTIPKLDLRGKKINSKHFDFDTTNLFCVGSPSGFFLLLERGKLCPRRGQKKPGADAGDDEDKSVVGEAGTLGCLAVENIYNIMHCNDPIAYRLNPTVDPQYAASLKVAHVPNATTGFFEGIGNVMKAVTPGMSAPSNLAVGQVAAPPVGITRLPSQLEMEVHDFSREEIAEKKFYLLNDNCQVDWLLDSTGGVAYFEMLGAHSSYWDRKEFIRLLVTEMGRKPGKQFTLPNMRAVKTAHKG